MKYLIQQNSTGNYSSWRVELHVTANRGRDFFSFVTRSERLWSPFSFPSTAYRELFSHE